MAQILVAEDEAMLRLIAVEMLEDAGFTVFQAADGVEALALLKANPDIALLVSDIKMPRMDGYTLVQAGRELKPELKVLLMTGYSQEPPPNLPAFRAVYKGQQLMYRLSIKSISMNAPSSAEMAI